jgi:hypothetical protein
MHSPKETCSRKHESPTFYMHAFTCSPHLHRATSATPFHSTGTYCPSVGLVAPLPCPPGAACALGAAQPQPCAPGFRAITVNDGDDKNTDINTDVGVGGGVVCAPCPAGHYCQDGVARACDAGYWCRSASVSARPRGVMPLPTLAAPCPRGHWCARAATEPVPCVAGTYTINDKNNDNDNNDGADENDDVGATKESDCVACPQGSDCARGSLTPPVAVVCPRGHRCDAHTGAATPCGPGMFARNDKGTSTPLQMSGEFDFFFLTATRTLTHACTHIRAHILTCHRHLSHHDSWLRRVRRVSCWIPVRRRRHGRLYTASLSCGPRLSRRLCHCHAVRCRHISRQPRGQGRERVHALSRRQRVCRGRNAHCRVSRRSLLRFWRRRRTREVCSGIRVSDALALTAAVSCGLLLWCGRGVAGAVCVRILLSGEHVNTVAMPVWLSFSTGV